MSMTVTMRAESAATETAIADAAIVRPSSVGSRPARGTAIARPHKAHRYGADGGGAHQRQHNSPRTFHGTTCKPSMSNVHIEARAFASRKRKRMVSRDRAAHRRHSRRITSGLMESACAGSDRTAPRHCPCWHGACGSRSTRSPHAPSPTASAPARGRTDSSACSRPRAWSCRRDG